MLGVVDGNFVLSLSGPVVESTATAAATAGATAAARAPAAAAVVSRAVHAIAGAHNGTHQHASNEFEAGMNKALGGSERTH